MIGFHMLAHEGEPQTDILWWAEAARVFADVMVIVWTSESTPPVPLVPDACWVHHPLADDFSAARNTALDRLREAGAEYAFFADPDERLVADPAQVRRSLAWCRRQPYAAYETVITRVGDGHPSVTVRIHTLAPWLRFRGRVHENLDAAFQAERRRWSIPGALPVGTAPFQLTHQHVPRTPEEHERRRKWYGRLLTQDVIDHPHDFNALMGLARHEQAEGRLTMAKTLYERAGTVSPNHPAVKSALAVLKQARKSGRKG